MIEEPRVSRRKFVTTTGCALASVAFGATRVSSFQFAYGARARLTARPKAGIVTSLKSGPLGFGGGPGLDGIIQMPAAAPAGKVPLLVFLHGASGGGPSVLRRIEPAADVAGIAVLCPDSRGITWDAIRGADFGEDVVFLNRALEFVFDRLDVDPARVAIGGFSDGATYGLSLGLANGDLFPRIVACSPGFVIQAPQQGRPKLFFSHGTADQTLPIDQCSRVIVPRLRTMGYDVTFREFEGRHELPPDIATEAMQWMAR
jgi:phospholipase/carboxylesterase